MGTIARLDCRRGTSLYAHLLLLTLVGLGLAAVTGCQPSQEAEPAQRVEQEPTEQEQAEPQEAEVVLEPIEEPVAPEAPAGPRLTVTKEFKQPEDPMAQRLAIEPVAALRDIYERCRELDEYTLTFYRQERLGLLVAKMQPLEEIHAKYRSDPFSVKFTWDSEEAQLYESTFVEGENLDKLIVRERKGVFPFPPQVRVMDPQFTVQIGKSKNPITFFGLAQMMRRTLEPFDNQETAEIMTVTYEGLTDLEITGQSAHYVKITRPKTPGLDYTRQDFYIDAETQLPAGTDLYLPDGKLDARYRYANVNTDVSLTDADFRMDEDHPDEATIARMTGAEQPKQEPSE
jgi:hypothetical protein